MSRLKRCFVPQCHNDSSLNPPKLFFCVPINVLTRKKWFQAAKRQDNPQKSTKFFCCEDHFDLEADFENFLMHQLMGSHLKLKAGVVPHLFDCKRKRTLAHSSQMTVTVDKRKRKAIVDNLLKDSQEEISEVGNSMSVQPPLPTQHHIANNEVELEADSENFLKDQLSHIKLKAGAVPHLLDCKKKRTRSSHTRATAVTRTRKAIVDNLLEDSQEEISEVGSSMSAPHHIANDELELEADSKNVLKDQRMGSHIKLKAGVVPHLFDSKRKRTRSPQMRATADMRIRKAIVDNLLKDSQEENSEHDILTGYKFHAHVKEAHASQRNGEFVNDTVSSQQTEADVKPPENPSPNIGKYEQLCCQNSLVEVKSETLVDEQNESQIVHLKRYPCLHCDEIYLTNHGLSKHINEAHVLQESVSFQCQLCKSLFPSECYLQHHENTCNLTNYKYKCNYCSMFFATKQKRSMHLMVKHENAYLQFKCRKCNGYFISEFHLHKHFKSLHSTRVYSDSLQDSQGDIQTPRTSLPAKCEHLSLQDSQGDIQTSKTSLPEHLSDQFPATSNQNSLLESKDKAINTKMPVVSTDFSSKSEGSSGSNKRVLCGFKCKICNFLANTERKQYLHFKREHALSIRYFKCSKCNSLFKSKHYLRTHFEDYHSNNSSTYETTIQALPTAPGPSTQQQETTSTTSNHPSLLKSHDVASNGTCPISSDIGSSKIKSEMDSPLVCYDREIPTEETASAAELESLKGVEKGLSNCSHCGFSSEDSNSLNDHYLTCHLGVHVKVEVKEEFANGEDFCEDEDRKYYCSSKCGFTSEDLDNFNSHYVNCHSARDDDDVKVKEELVNDEAVPCIKMEPFNEEDVCGIR